MAVTVTAVIIGSVLVVSDVARAVDVNSPPRISIGGASVVEGNMNRRFLRFSVTLSWPAPGPITVQYATGDPGDSATAPADYVAKAGTLSFTAKQRNKFVAVRTQVDTIVEGDQTFTMKLSSPSGASLGIDTATATIIDDDPPVGNRVSIGDATIVEPCAGPKVLTSVMITLAARLNTSEVVNVVTGPLSGGATAGVDYTAMNKTFTFAAGNFTKELKVPILSDLALEGAEQFQVTLTLISGAAPVGKATGTVTIIDCQPT
jgi:chitinase